MFLFTNKYRNVGIYEVWFSATTLKRIEVKSENSDTYLRNRVNIISFLFKGVYLLLGFIGDLHKSCMKSVVYAEKFEMTYFLVTGTIVHTRVKVRLWAVFKAWLSVDSSLVESSPEVQSHRTTLHHEDSHRLRLVLHCHSICK